MVNPVPGRSITTPYGKRGSAWATGVHGGADWAAPRGTTVVAPWGGNVVGAGGGGGGWGSAYGNAVVIDFDKLPDGSPGLWGVLAHLSRVTVKVGQRVEAGQKVGEVGQTGNATGDHLHFEVQPQARWVRGSYRDPARHVAASKGGTAPTDKPVTLDIYSDKLGYGQRDSDSVKELQRRLNGISLKGGTTLPVTGNYLDKTDQEVRLWQAQVCGDKPDPVGKSYLGPKQRARMFPVPPYRIHDKGLPAIARGDGGGVTGDVGGGAGGTVEPAPADPLRWHASPSLLSLRAEVDARWPNRDKSSDGTIGDYAHSTSMSEHNPVGHRFGPQHGTVGAVHAIDITAKGIDVRQVLDAVIGDKRVWYVIHAGSIWSKTYNWAQRGYNGSNPHDTHIHVSLAADDQASAIANEKDQSPWLEDVAAPPPEPEGGVVTREEFDEWRRRVAEAIGG
jgi:murein DD-endopeptidase MepM/ murein hydrolase activator NlpD